ncbi:hypothetical protein V5O48_015956 [Marasmius crinis-equi]|uniref:Uncharacterized protein n=1 Tax=Marasmius crinis-equi TaxID=585013 RepID=A0ABR3ET48_9AGAR
MPRPGMTEPSSDQQIAISDSFRDIEDIIAAYEYEVFINTNTFAVGREQERYVALQLFGYAHREPAMRHFVRSRLDCFNKEAEHLDGKGIIGASLESQDSVPTGNGFMWAIIANGPYIENSKPVLLGYYHEPNETKTTP